jgi:oxygen-independent coproporphyrinogen-3 oxidase
MQDLHIYIHWPFCLKKCPYCDFNSHIFTTLDHDNMLTAYLNEIDLYADLLNNRHIKSIFFGGGTPSLMEPKVIEKIILYLQQKSNISSNIEITLEANPTSIEISKFRNFKIAGINRISIGIQSFNDKNLSFLGREHNAKDAEKAIKIAHSTFDNFSIDLIYALPQQTPADWQKELHHASKFIDKHVSCYQLTIEKATKFYQLHQNKAFTLPAEDLCAEMYNNTAYILAKKNIHQYEISNYAADDFHSLHNLAYWQLNDYIGFGPGAHSRYTKKLKTIYAYNFYPPTKWQTQLHKNLSPRQNEKILSTEEIRLDKIMMGLRINAGIDQNLIRNKQKLAKLFKSDLLETNRSLVRLTSKGKLLLNSIVKQIY